MTFTLPQVWILLVPLGLLVWKTGRRPGPPLVLRGLLLVLVLGALSGPSWTLRDAGGDVVVVVDRSRSMPGDAGREATETVALLEAQRRAGDRVGVIAFGREARVEQPLSEAGHFGGFTRPVDAEASDLSAALDAAGALIPPGRTGRVVVLSDGRATGADARGAARRLAARGLAVDFRQLAREDVPLDLAVLSLDTPTSVTAREPFQMTGVVRATAPVTGRVRLERNGRVLLQGPFDFQAGPNLLPLRDVVDTPGLVSYRLTVEAPGDGVVENDVGQAIVRVEGPPRVLLLTDSPEGTLARALRAAGLTLEVRAPFRLTLEALEGVGALVLENVDANRLGEPGLRAVAAYVEVAGGGLVMTGGRASFSEGGYRHSPVEPLLPVSLEMREEQRRIDVALSVLMDCSCSMGVQIPDGRTKMELAAEGVVGALTLLNPKDEASVAMVDTEVHRLFPMSPVERGLPLNEVARGFSGGGGIYVGTALREGRDQVLGSQKATRHVLLFSDAADSEQAADYRETLEALRQQKVTVSVIGLGTEKDPDAALLREIAERGGGRMYFAEDAASLPRIFSQETLTVARATFVDTPTSLEAAPDLPLLGPLPALGLPQVGGYNLAYLRPRASVALRTLDDHAAPVLALWPRGAGRAVAFLAEVDGEYTGELRTWTGLRGTLEGMVRWALGGAGGGGTAVARSERRGDRLRVSLDFAPGEALPGALPSLVVLPGDGRSAPVEVPLRWEDEERMVAEYTLPGSGSWHPVVKLGTRVLRAPPVTLPYAPEFEPGSRQEGLEVLRGVAAVGGGVELLSLTGVFARTPGSEGRVALAPWLVALALGALLAEVAVRRFLSGPRPLRRAPAASPAAAPPSPEPSPQAADVGDALDAARARARKRLGR
ncbi:VWA domain-containing protein [Archangium primigenium]|uniref:VWA domain-containing protein n=1 Tax=[Archangium] primigenium TaxID=2792470 RepID=UPI00195AAABC|nr:VWA domain-containing protein [Archangium primigenium]MBM7113474.1 VWA domain-containing protein [Archangium primigenium]